MYKIIHILIFSLFSLAALPGQVPDRLLDKDQYPANNTVDSKREAIFAGYFEDANVSNLHVYVPREPAGSDYYFAGTELPRGLFGLFDPEWRKTMPDEFKAFAVFSIRGAGKPYYLLRFSGQDLKPVIALFEIQADQLKHKVTLATNWCGEELCFQMDSWVQDFDGDVLLDVLSKVRMTDNLKKLEFLDEYYSKLRQLEDGRFEPDSKMDIEVKEYFMYPDPEVDNEPTN